MTKVAPSSVLVMLILALGLLSASCAAAQMGETQSDLTPVDGATSADQVPTRTAAVASGMPSATHITYRPEWLAGGSLSLAGAQAQVRTFLGEPAAVLEGYFEDEAAPGVGSNGRPIISLSNRKLFRIQHRVAGAPSPDEFSVDASSGEVIDAFLHSHAIHNASKPRIGEAQAKVTAEEFGRTRFADFDMLSLHDPGALGMARDGVSIYIVQWRRRAESGAWLPSSLQIGVDMETGQVVAYYAQRVDYRGPTVPAISRERAIELALAEARKDARLAAAKAGRVELTTSHIRFSEWRLTWSVSIEGVAGVAVRQFSLDAFSGQVLNPQGSPLG